MKLIAGLGNPGTQYRNTRHNLGFDILDALAQSLGVQFDKEKHNGQFAQAMYQGEKLLLLKPLTYMNRSGDCIAKHARNKVHEPEDILIIVDDINLPLGRMRLRTNGSAGGHNGLKSIIERLGTKDFHRLRIGVGDNRQGKDLADHVLSKFRPDEKNQVQESIDKSVEAATLWINHQPQDVMNQFN